MESKVVVPAQGKKITLQNGKLNVPENPIIPYIEGDGIGGRFAAGPPSRHTCGHVPLLQPHEQWCAASPTFFA